MLRKTGDTPGFADTELTVAYQIASKQDERFFTIVPVRLENCPRGDHRLSTFHQFDLFEDWGGQIGRLVKFFGAEVVKGAERASGDDLVQTLRGRASAAYYAGDLQAAVRDYEALSVLAPEAPQIWNNLGVALDAAGRVVEAINAFHRSIELNSDSWRALRNLGSVLSRQRRYYEAMPLFERALALMPSDSDVLYDAGVTLGHLGDHDLALELFNQLWETGVRDRFVLHARATALLNLRRHEEACAAFAEALAVLGANADLLFGKGFALMALSRDQEAIEAFDSVLALDPSHELAAGYRSALLNS